MEVVARVLAGILGVGAVLAVLGSAIRTVVVPRAEPVRITRVVFLVARWFFLLRARHTKEWQDVDRIMARYAPTTLVVLPAVWITSVLFGFAALYWAVGIEPAGDAIRLSGSSLLTLGFAVDDRLGIVGLHFAEAIIGLGLAALLISFLPTIYAQFSHREVAVAQLETRAGTPPTPSELLRRAHRIGWLEQLDDLWIEWERWFVEIEESHTSYGALSFFRSTHHERSWITAAGCILDTAALRASVLQLPRSYRAELCLRSGYLSLRSIADFFSIPYDRDPAPDAPISIGRDEFDRVYAELAADGLPVRPDRDRAWRDYAGWRVNYDTVLLALATLTMAPYAPWSADRSMTVRRPPLLRRHGR